MKQMLIYAERDLVPYFKALVEGAITHQNLDVTTTSQFYLVSLLSRFVKTEQLFDFSAGHYEETPLAFLLSKALHSDQATSVKALKKLGDVSLYMAGYFTDHIDLKQVDVEYYISMGEGAYKSLSGMLSGEQTFYELYDELAAKFVGCVDVLAEVSGAGGVPTNTEIIRLYERWLKTGDQRIKQRLEREGIAPKDIFVSGKKH